MLRCIRSLTKFFKLCYKHVNFKLNKTKLSELPPLGAETPPFEIFRPKMPPFGKKCEIFFVQHDPENA